MGRGWCQSLDFEIMKELQVDLVFAAVGALRGEMTISLFLRFAVVDDRSAVVGTIMYIPLNSCLGTVQEDCKYMEHFAF
jgi:hypothetical protein